MVGTQHADAGPPQPNVDVLVEGIRELLRAVRTVRQAGVTVQLPHRLVRVCREVLDEVEASAGSSVAPVRVTRSRSDDSQESVMDKTLREVPLRRLLWQVINPGETFTVSTVVDRLARLGMEVEPAKVSNALGYWVARDRLIRERKGVYNYPVEATPVGASSTDVQDNASATGVVGGSTHNDRRHPGNDHDRRAVAARGQEDSSGQSPVQERRKAV